MLPIGGHTSALHVVVPVLCSTCYFFNHLQQTDSQELRNHWSDLGADFAEIRALAVPFHGGIGRAS